MATTTLKDELIKKEIVVQKSKPVLAYLSALFIVILVIVWRLELWKMSLSIPLTYYVDSIGVQALIKGVVENGWWFYNPNLGAPVGLSLMDYPNADGFHLLVIKFMSFFTKESGSLLNGYFLLTYPLTALTTMYTFRKLNFSYLSSIVASVLYAFIPYHLYRGQGHFFLAAYYVIPLVVLVTYWTYLGELNVFSKAKLRDKLTDSKIIISVLTIAVLGQSGLYYAFFSIILILMVGLIASIQNNNLVMLKNAGTLILILLIVMLLGFAPHLLYKAQHGPNPATAIRQGYESELLGLKIIQLMLPAYYHRNPVFANVTREYVSTAPNINENQDSTLGLTASLGFLFLLLWVLLKDASFFKFLRDKERILLNYLGAINLIALLLGTVAGFGTLIAYLFTPQIRGYNRISIFIAFFALMAIILVLDSLYKKYMNKTRNKIFFYFLFFSITVFGLYDQVYTGPTMYKEIAAEYNSEELFVKNIEQEMPKNAMIFQLPYVAFPESTPVHNLLDYNLFRAYLHSTDLRWSYGAVKGRQGDAWQKQVSAKPTKQFIEEIKRMGFKGVYIDRFGFEDSAQALEREVSSLLKEKPLVSPNQRQSFFKLR